MRLVLALSGVLAIATTALLVSGCRPIVVVVRPVTVSAAAESVRAVDLAFGDTAFCALREDGQVWCWGKGDRGGLGDGSKEARSVARPVPGLDQVSEIAGFPYRGFCALRRDRSLRCWGFNDFQGALPRQKLFDDVVDFTFSEDRDVTSPFPSSTQPGVCVRHSNGAVACLQLAANAAKQTCVRWSTSDGGECLRWEVPVEVHPAPYVAENVQFGGKDNNLPARPYDRACILRGHQVFCRGSNGEGELGEPSWKEVKEWSPVPGLSDIVSLSTGGSEAVAVRANGEVVSWGKNDGDFPVAPDADPCTNGVQCSRRPMAWPIRDVAQIKIPNSLPWLVMRDGRVLSYAVRGPRLTIGGYRPGTFEVVAGLPPVARVEGGFHVACALSRDGQIFCWGHGAVVGDGALLSSRQPVLWPSEGPAIAVRALTTEGPCILHADGRATCSGTDEPPQGLHDVAGLGEGCVVGKDGRVRCWGSNGDGQMGLGRQYRPDTPQYHEFDPAVTSIPLPVPGLHDVVDMTTDHSKRCTIDRKGSVSCWGMWVPPKMYTWAPTTITPLPPARRALTTTLGLYVLARDGSIWSFTDDRHWDGKKFAGQPVPHNTGLGPAADLPTDGQGNDGVTHIGKGEYALCWIALDRSLACTGQKAPLPRIEGVKQLSMARDRGCVVLANGQLQCWGDGYCAEDDHGRCLRDPWNRVVTLLDGAAQVSVANDYACAVRTDGSVWCWGDLGVARGGDLAPERFARVALH